MEILVFHLQLLQNSLLWEFSENSKFWLLEKQKWKIILPEQLVAFRVNLIQDSD